MEPEARINPGDLVTDRFGVGCQMFQNMYTSKMRHVRMRTGDVGVVTRLHTGFAHVLFNGEVWMVAPEKLRVVKDEENQ